MLFSIISLVFLEQSIRIQTCLYDNRNIVGTPIDIIMNEDDTKNTTALSLNYDYTNLENTLGSEVEEDLVICKNDIFIKRLAI